MQIDEQRHNQVMMIDGSRGAGKTVTLISLLEVLRCSIVDKEVPKSLSEIASIVPEGRVFPLRMLDLRPFPVGRSLILEVPGAFLPVVEWLETRENKAPASGDAPPPIWEQNEHPARTAWRQFSHAAAKGYARDVREGNVEPGRFVRELEQAGVERASIQGAFAELIGELVRGVSTKGDALFVLPIDDADMQPDRCLDILDMLRFFHHPRVAFVLTGETRQFEDMLRAQTTSWLAGDSSDVFLEHRQQEISERAASLAMQFFEKHIPSADRLELPELAPAHRLGLVLPTMRARGDAPTEEASHVCGRNARPSAAGEPSRA